MSSCCIRFARELLSTVESAARRPIQGRAAPWRAQKFAWLTLLAALLVSPAFAQTPVSGAIAVNTHWTTAESPYVVSGDVVVQNGAVLTIDPGVTVYMAGASSLTVQSGGVQAVGTAADPIRVFSDKTRTGQPAAPGDYKAWTFNAGTSATRLEHAVFQHGAGLVVRGSSPIFNYLNLRNNLGAAITIDLAASPTGVGNQASGNTLNGIAVPPGDIGGNVQWGLRGIPYMVSAGVVSVGASPVVTNVTPNAIQQGETATLTLTGSRLAGLTQVSFDSPDVTAQILAGGTGTQATMTVTAGEEALVGAAGMKLLVDAGEVKTGGALTIAPSQPTIVGVAPDKIYVGQGAAQVQIDGRGFTSESVAQLNGTAVATQFQSASQVRATVPNQTVASNLSLRLRTPDPVNAGQFLTSNEVVLPVLPAQLTLMPATTTAIKGLTREFTLTLPYAAPAGSTSVNLVSSVPTVGSVPTTVLVPEGGTTATFALTAIEIGNTVVTASKSGYISGQAQVTVVPPPTLAITPSVLNLGVGRTSDITLQSSVAAGAPGLVIALSSSDPSIATLPATATIPAGSKTTTATVTTSAIGSVTIQASATEYVPASAVVNVRPVSINLPAGALVAPSLSRSIPMTLSDPAPAGGLEVALQSSNAAIASTPASITVPAGEINANFVLTGVAAGSAAVAATAAGYQGASMPVTVESVSIGVGSPAVTSISVPAEASVTYPLTLSRPAPIGGVVVDLSTADPAIATVSPSSITIAEGETSGGTQRLTVTGVTESSTTLVANAGGLNSANLPLTVTAKAELRFSKGSVVVGKALRTYISEVYVARYTDDGAYTPNEPLTVNLSSSDQGKASVPATVIIPAGEYYVRFYVTGVDFTDGTPVTIDASAAGYAAPTTKLAANVIAPVFNITELDASRSSASSRDNVRVYVTVPGATYSGNQVAAAHLPIDLSIMEGSPAGIIDAFYSAQTGGTPVTQMLLRKDETYSDYAYVGTPTAAGSYKVRFSSTGVATATSGVVTVNPPELRFSRGTVVVGKGLQTYLSEVNVYRAVNGVEFSGNEALTVNLSNSDAGKITIPASVTIPAGSSNVRFYVTGVEFTNGTPVTIDASAAGYTAPATKLAASVVAPVLNITELDANRSPASSRDNVRIYVTVPGATYSGNQTAAAHLPIDLSIMEGSPAGIIDAFYNAQTGGAPITQILLRQNETYSDYAYVGTPTAAGSYKVQFGSAGVATATSGVVTVSPPELRFSRSTVVAGKGMKTYISEVNIYRAVNGIEFNGVDALTVNLTSSDASKVSVPATVTIPAGSYYVRFFVTGVDFTNGTPVTIDASAAGYTAPPTKLAASVIAPVLNVTELDANRSPASSRDNVRVYVTVPGATYSGNQTAAAHLPIDLSIVEGSPAGIIDGFYSAQAGGTPITQILLRQDETYSDYAYVGTPTAAGSYKVRFGSTGVATATSSVVTVSPPELRFSRSTVIVGKALKTYVSEVHVYRAVNGIEFNGVEPLSVNLACSSTAICTVPATVTIPANSYYVRFYVTGVGLGNTTITASAIGHNSVQDLDVSVITPQLNFSGLSGTRIGTTSNFPVYLTTPGATYSSNQTAVAALQVNLTSSAPEVATVTAAVTIPADGTYSNNAALTGASAGTTTITASGAGLSTVSSAVTITP